MRAKALAGVCALAFSARVSLSQKCGSGLLEGVSRTCMQFGGMERCWYKVVPDGIDSSASASVPIMVIMHGYTLCAEGIGYIGWNSIAKSDGYILLSPQGAEAIPGYNPETPPAWNADLRGTQVLVVRPMVLILTTLVSSVRLFKKHSIVFLPLMQRA